MIRGSAEPAEAKRGQLLLESLEKRQMLAADSDLLFTDGLGVFDTSVSSAEVATALPVTGQAEGEPAPDLVQFAKDLTAAGVEFFGAEWCPFCTDQKELFEDGERFLPFIEVTNPDRSLNSIGIAEGISQFPTWKFPSGQVRQGVLTLAEISTLSGVSIPQGEQPSFVPVGNQTVFLGSPLHIPIDAYDPNGGPLTVTVSIDNPALLEATVLSGNRSIRIDMVGWGDMVFELFEGRAPVPAGRVINLANSGFYDGIIFHRVVDDFVIQAGDPLGNGTGGSSLPDFDDQFHPDLQHNRSGVLSFAKGGDDTNNSQFFITETPTRSLDFNHSIFGQLVEGNDVREAISETATGGSQGTTPTNPVRIESIDVFNDIENSVVMLKALGNSTGSTNVTFTVRDQNGNSFSETILVTVANDTANGQPYLNPITPPATTSSSSVAQLQLTSVDVEGDPVSYFADRVSSASGGTVSTQLLTNPLDANRGKTLVTVTPASGASDPLSIQLSSTAIASETVTYFIESVSGASAGTATINATSGLITVTPSGTSSGSIQFRVGSRNASQTLRGVFVQSIDGPAGTVSINATSGLATVTPESDFDGTMEVRVGVRPGNGVTGNALGDFDLQSVDFVFEGEQTIAAPTAVDLQTGSDTGASNIDNITNAGSLSFNVAGVTSGATVELINTNSGSVVGTGVATGTSIIITTNNIAALGDGTYPIAARQRVAAQTSALSPSLSLVYDTTAPASVIASASKTGNVGRVYETDLINSEEGSGLVYALTSAPTGATINPTSGQISWTPLEANLGNNTFALTLTDAAGNTRSESFSVAIAGEPLAEIRLDLTDLQGNPITTVSVGDKFLLNLVAVDARLFNKPGVFSAYADILFDSSIVRPEPGSAIAFSDDFTVERKGTFSTGLIDELGAVSNFLNATNDPENVIATVRMEAIASGTLNIRSEPADESDSDVLLFFEDDRIPAEAVFYGDTTLAVGQTFTVGADTFTVAEDSAATTLNVLANDQIISGNGTLSIISVTQPTTGGTVTLNNGTVRFTPTANFNGTSVFTYRVGSGGVQQDGTVTVTVTPVNDPPTAVDDTFNVDQNSTGTTLDLIGNDLITPDANESLTITAVGTPTGGGTVTISAGGQSVVYRPAAGFTGIDTFSYTISDGGLTDTGQVTVTVAPADNPPTAVNDAFSVTEDAAQASFNVLANDTRDVDNQSFTMSSVGTPSQGGTVSISGDGTQMLYRPAANFAGTETVTYTIRDTGGGLSVGTVTFTVTAVNDPPPIENASRTITRGTPESSVYAISNLPANPDAGETLNFTNVTSPTTAGGTVRVASGSQSILYTPPSATFAGTDTFTYTVSDGSGLTSTGTITINVANFTERDIILNSADSASFAHVNGILLKGTNLLGNTVEVPLTIDAQNARFDNVLPGDYMIEIPAIPFLQNGSAPTQIPVTSAANDGDTTIDTLLGRLRPEYLSIRDWLGSAPRKNVLIAVLPGNSSTLAIPSPSTDTIMDPAINLNDAGTALTIRGTQNGSTTPVEVTLPTTSDARVQLRGEAGGMRLYKVSVDSNVTFAPVAAVAASAAEGEASSSFVLGDIQAEGESPAVAAITQADLFVPVGSGNSTRSDATVLALAEADLWFGTEATKQSTGANPYSESSVDSAFESVGDLTLEIPGAAAIHSDSSLDHSIVDQALNAGLVSGF